MRKLIFLVVLALSGPLAADTQSEIRTALDYYAQIWNENDLDAIGGYYHQDFVLVTDGGTVPRQQQLDDIRGLGGDGGDRGKLSYSAITVKELGESHAVAYGQLTVEFEDDSSLESWFTTLYVKTPFGWKALLTRN